MDDRGGSLPGALRAADRHAGGGSQRESGSEAGAQHRHVSEERREQAGRHLS